MDRYRTVYRELSQEEKNRFLRIKELAAEMEAVICGGPDKSPPTREASLAVTKLEEAVMWGVKSVTG